jgi:hypothetical protein
LSEILGIFAVAAELEAEREDLVPVSGDQLRDGVFRSAPNERILKGPGAGLG